MNPSLREQLDSLMRGIRVSVPAEVADDIEKRIESYAATREAEGRKEGATKLWAKISVAVGLWLPAFNSKPEEAKAAKMLIKVMTNEKDDYLKALTDTQGDTK